MTAAASSLRSAVTAAVAVGRSQLRRGRGEDAAAARRSGTAGSPLAVTPAPRSVPIRSAGDRASLVHRLALAAVWLAFAASGVVFSEPAPVDALMMGLIVLLPVVGLVRITRGLVAFLALWLVVTAAGFLAAALTPDFAEAARFQAVSLYLVVAAFVIAAFVARRPVAHTRIVLTASLIAALVAAFAGIVGYFGALPGADVLFTKFGRATGTFKDPNVFAPFLVPPTLFALHMALTRPARIALPMLAALGILALAVLLSFSRGGWINLGLAVVLFCGVSFLTATRTVDRMKLVGLAAAAALVIAIGLAIALQTEAVAKLMAERAQLTQSYDSGPDGRFGGQAKAIGLVLENPLGIGATTFAGRHHSEEVHNVYLSMLLNAGWLGGGLYAVLVVATLLIGVRESFRVTPWQPLALIAFAAFAGNAFEGFVIDSDHWRVFYLEMALIWGLAAAGRPDGAKPAPTA